MSANLRTAIRKWNNIFLLRSESLQICSGFDQVQIFYVCETISLLNDVQMNENYEKKKREDGENKIKRNE